MNRSNHCAKAFRKCVLQLKTCLVISLLLFTGYLNAQQGNLSCSLTNVPMVNTSPFAANTFTPSLSSTGLAGWGFSDDDDLVDGNLNNSVSGGSIVTGSVTASITDPVNDYAAGNYVGFVVNQGLSLLSNMTIRTYLNGSATPQETMGGTSLLALSLLGGKTEVGFYTNKPFDMVTVTVGGVAATLTVYHAIIRGTGSCSQAVNLNCNTFTPLTLSTQNAVTTYGVTDFTGLGLSDITSLLNFFSDMGNITDENLSNAASVTPVAGVAGTAYVSVKNTTGTYNASVSAPIYAGFDLETNTVLNADLLSGMTIKILDNGVEKGSATGNNLLAGVTLLGASGRQKIGFLATVPFDEIRLEFSSGLLSVAVGTTKIYSAVVKRFCDAAPIDCNSVFKNTPISISDVDHPVYINLKNTGTTGLAAVQSNFLANADRIIDGNANTAATMIVPASVGTSGTVSVAKAIGTYEAGSFAGFDIAANSLLDASVLASVQIALYNDGVPLASNTTGNRLIVGAKSSLLGNGRSRQTIGVVAPAAFDEVKIIFNNLVAASLGTVDIYNFIVQKNCAAPIACNQSIQLKTPDYGVVINNERTGMSGLATVAGSVDNPGNLINSNATDYATIEFNVAGVGGTGSISVLSPATTFPGGTFAGFLIRDHNSLITLDLLNSIQVKTFYKGNPKETKTAADLLDLSVVIPLFSSYGTKIVGFVTTEEYDEIQISSFSLLGVIRKIDVFSAIVDTRYVTPGTQGLSCTPLYTKPDINFTIINKQVSGSVATNDKMGTGVTYSNPLPVAGADGVGNATGVNFQLQSDGSYTFMATVKGSYSFDIDVCTTAGCKKEILTIEVSEPAVMTNNPILNTDIAATKTATPVTIAVLANDHAGNPGGVLGSPSIDVMPKRGTAVINSGNIVYTPEAGFVGLDTLVYQVCETPANTCSKAYVFFRVDPPNVPVTMASEDFTMGNNGQTVTGNVKTNDTDPNGYTQTVTPQTINNASGDLVINGDGSYSFTPAPGVSGTSQFTYVVSNTGNPQASTPANLYVYTADAADQIDLAVNITISPSTFTGETIIRCRIGVFTTTPMATDGSPVYILIPKSSRYTLETFDPAATSISGLPVQNSSWTYDGETGSAYRFKLGDAASNLVIAGGGGASFIGVRLKFTPGSSGEGNIFASIQEGSGGDVNDVNNLDSERIIFKK